MVYPSQFVACKYTVLGRSIGGVGNGIDDDLRRCAECRYFHNVNIPFLLIPPEIMEEILDAFDGRATAGLLAAFPHSKIWFATLWNRRLSASLSHYGIDAETFLPALFETNSLAYGMAVLNAIHPDTLGLLHRTPQYRETILEMSNFKEDLQFINIVPQVVARLGYRCMSTRDYLRRFPDVKIFKKSINGESVFVFVFILQKLQPLIFPITLLPTTLLMNFTDGESITSLYPTATWDRVAISSLPEDYNRNHPRRFYTEHPKTHNVPIFESLHSFGFKIVEDMLEDQIGRHMCGFHPLCPDTIRSYPGPGIWKIRLVLPELMALGKMDSSDDEESDDQVVVDGVAMSSEHQALDEAITGGLGTIDGHQESGDTVTGLNVSASGNTNVHVSGPIGWRPDDDSESEGFKPHYWDADVALWRLRSVGMCGSRSTGAFCTPFPEPEIALRRMAFHSFSVDIASFNSAEWQSFLNYVSSRLGHCALRYNTHRWQALPEQCKAYIAQLIFDIEKSMLIQSAATLSSPGLIFTPPILKSLYKSMVEGGLDHPIHALGNFRVEESGPDDPMDTYVDAWWLEQPLDPRCLTVEQLVAAWKAQRSIFESRPLSFALHLNEEFDQSAASFARHALTTTDQMLSLIEREIDEGQRVMGSLAMALQRLESSRR
ncbi:hypothetical protein BKA70DRAFT_1427350 [Coprinopsis sp. MPI-PUGE-AT-0042]|nr:hypothetical protein BKA70DRAFT_1427350 [Coprinopsis sp. MPI-PUGE-AT-0042]